MSETQEKYEGYSMPPTPGELLDAALLELDAVTDENFREKIEAAVNCIHDAKSWVDSHLLFAREPQAPYVKHPAEGFLLDQKGNPVKRSAAYPKIITTPREELQRRQENEQKQMKEASDRALRASKGIPSDAYPKIITTTREELQRRQENEQKQMKGEA